MFEHVSNGQTFGYHLTEYAILIRKRDGSDASLLSYDDHRDCLTDVITRADKYKSINDAITSYKERIFCVEYYIDTKVYDTRNVEIVPVYTTIETGKGQTMEELHVNLND